MTELRPARPDDIKQIQIIEKEYYEGFTCPEDVLKCWIKNLPENFIVAVNDVNVIGFIFFEYLNEIRALPFLHKLKHKPKGKYVYVSEVGILDEFRGSDALQSLFEKLVEKSKKDGIKAIIWLTGSKMKHDNIESEILLSNGFEKKENVKNWEAYPGYFVDDHFIWIKEL